tara:strand:- start:46545 stop:47705 length:1161 start_codon:yes stop_codon:yes gene_type:complete
MAIVKLILAHDLGNGIGLDNKIPWDCPEDLKYFQRVTMGDVCLVTRKTFESILQYAPKGLKGRKLVVLTRNSEWTHPVADEVIVDSPIYDVLQGLKLKYPDQDVSIIGGGELYEQAMVHDLVDEYHVTQINSYNKCDVTFNLIDDLKPFLRFGEITKYDSHTVHVLRPMEDIKIPIDARKYQTAMVTHARLSIKISEENFFKTDNEFLQQNKVSQKFYIETVADWIKTDSKQLSATLGSDMGLYPASNWVKLNKLEESGIAYIVPRTQASGNYVYDPKKMQRELVKWKMYGGKLRAPHTVVVIFNSKTKMVSLNVLKALLADADELIRKTDLKRCVICNVAKSPQVHTFIDALRKLIPDNFEINVRNNHLYLEKKSCYRQLYPSQG